MAVMRCTAQRHSVRFRGFSDQHWPFQCIAEDVSDPGRRRSRKSSGVERAAYSIPDSSATEQTGIRYQQMQIPGAGWLIGLRTMRRIPGAIAILKGYGYELTDVDVIDAFNHLMTRDTAEAS